MAKRRIYYLTLAVALFFSTQFFSFRFSPASAAEESKWTAVNIPAEGKRGSWQLADGSDVQHLTMSANGTLYAYARPASTNYTLFKSTDSGHRWSLTGQVTDNIVAIATIPGDANIVYYATSFTIHRSTDGGENFSMVALSPGGAGSGNVTITGLSIASVGSRRVVAVATADGDAGQYGGVYIADEDRLFDGWVNTNIGSYDVAALAFSPNYPSDRLLLAVAANETDTLVAARNGDTAWGALTGNAPISGVAARNAAIVSPPDFSFGKDRPTLFVAVDTGGAGGDVYRIELRQSPQNSRAVDLNVASADNIPNIDVTGLAVSGNSSGYHLFAGSANSSQIYASTNGGQSWVVSQKNPSGQSKTYLLLAPDFVQSRRVYAATSGSGSALSHSSDGGISWNQLALIDSRLNKIDSLAVSANFSQDGTLFMLTWGGEHSVWRSQNKGETWERVLSAAQAGASTLNILEVSPFYGDSVKAVYVIGKIGGQGVVWKSADGGQTFVRRSVPFVIDTMAVASDDLFFVSSFNGSAGLVYASANGGFFYSASAVAGSLRLKSIALSPDYLKDKTVLAGDTGGRVFLSTDNGTSFETLPVTASAAPLGGGVFVAYDPDFGRNGIVYAVSDTAATTQSKQRVYRFTIGKSSAWESIDSTLPVGSGLNRAVISPSGVLYVANAMAGGGMERSLSPSSLNASFETVTRGLSENATLNGLWISGNQLWSVDTRNTLLMTFVDSSATPIALVSPANKTHGAGVNNIKLDWQAAKGATRYKWQIDDDDNLASIDSGFEGETDGSSASPPPLRMSTTYYWRVRATEPVLGPWSAKWSFSTVLSGAASGPELYAPEAGASQVSKKPVFQWSAISGAERYELLVSANVSFSDPVISMTGNDALPSTAWKSDVELEYSSTYYWKVRGLGPASQSAWSAVGVFTTEKPPPGAASVRSATPGTIEPSSPLSQTPPTVPAIPSVPPPAPPQIIQPFDSAPSALLRTGQDRPALPEWSIYVGIALLGMITGLLVAIVALLVKKSRA